MLLRRKQNPTEDVPLIPHGRIWQSTEREAGDRSNNGTARDAKFSRLSAQMVELSLQEAQRQRTLGSAVPNKVSSGSSPLPWPSDVQRIAQPPTESIARPGMAAPKVALAAVTSLNPPHTRGTPRESRIPNFAVLYSRAAVILRETTNHWNAVSRILRDWLAKLRVSGSAALVNLRGYWKSVLQDHRVATFRARILSWLNIAAERSELIRQRTAFLIGRWSRSTASTTQFLAQRISAKLRRRLGQACRSNFRALTARAPSVWAVMKKKFAIWNVRLESMKPDSRLRVISSVRRYGPTPDTEKHNDRQLPSTVSPNIPARQGSSRRESEAKQG